MKAMFNGKELDRKEWKALLSDVDSRFEIVSLVQVPASPMAFFEVVWRG
jgi:hypothetical protein